MLRVTFGLALCWLLCACSSPSLRCDKHLQPINAPKSI